MSLSDTRRIQAQMSAPSTVTLWHALRPLRSVLSFMNTGAHPDDEGSAMLAALGLRDGVRVSVACSTRGEGGQNAIGVEAHSDLGIVRTAEMERAADILGIQHYWLSQAPDDTIFDFGFSKDGRETLAKWGHERTLERFVEVVRTERPDIICTTFLDVPGQHGHHRAMTRLAHEVVDAAADAGAFPDLGLAPWQVKKLYLPAWSGAGSSYDDGEPPPPETVRISGAGEDLATGATYPQLGQQSRLFHLTQGMGRWIDAGVTSDWPLHLARSTVGNRELTIGDGLPGPLSDLGDLPGAQPIRDELIEAHEQSLAAIEGWPNAGAVLSAAARAHDAVMRARAHCPETVRDEVAHRLQRKERELARVIALASGVQIRAFASPSVARPGDTVTVTVHAHSSRDDVAFEAGIVVPAGWTVEGDRVNLPADASVSDPYPDAHAAHAPVGPVAASLEVSFGTTKVAISVPLEEPLLVVPPTGGKLEPSAAIINLVTSPQHVDVRVDGVFPHNAPYELKRPEGWLEEALPGGIRLIAPRDVAAGISRIPLLVAGTPASTSNVINYPHTGPRVHSTPSFINVRTMRVELPTARVAYVGGGNDRVDHWLRALGMDVTALADETINAAGLAEFDSLLVGIFAMRTRPALRAAVGDLHAWIERGGNLMTLYHRPWDDWDPDIVPPRRLTVGQPSLRWRVTDENAAVTHLVPDHRLLTTPNRIGEDDWAGWHKERGLYFASEWDAAYTPLLSMSDPGEVPHEGALLSAEIGRGRHTHTGLILHHQMEHLVPGAFRLMVNLLA